MLKISTNFSTSKKCKAEFLELAALIINVYRKLRFARLILKD